MLNFIKHHLSKCSSEVKASAYLLTVQPVMEYARDSHYPTQVSMFKGVQLGVFFLTKVTSSVTAMLQQLNWLPLVKRRKHHRLNLFYQIIHGVVGLSLPEYVNFAILFILLYHQPPPPPTQQVFSLRPSENGTYCYCK